ncbi:MAG: AMP-binding protein [Candidatus Algichlamydia australiensis]|nr:AMP-binding protein [Chlamydiales bacterium]
MLSHTNSNKIAIQDGKRSITYGELEIFQQKSPPFYAHNTLESILYLLKSINPFPLSYRLPFAQAREFAQKETIYPSLLTSGSSGNPKIAQLTKENLIYSALGAIKTFDLNESDRFLLTLPYFHVGGLAIIWRALLSGGTLVIPQSPDFSKEIICEKITRVSFVPLQLMRLKKRAYPSLRTVLLGGQAMPHNLGSYDLPIWISYGMTEMSSVIAAAPWNPNQFLQVLPYRKLKLADDGEILVGGKTLFAGYLGEDAPGEWFCTKDIGRLSNQGLQIVGRKDRQFISGGENIQPEEIEAALLSIPEVQRALVEAKENPKFGMRPIAYLDPFPIVNIREKLEELLPRFKIPDNFFPLDREEKSAQLCRNLH